MELAVRVAVCAVISLENVQYSFQCVRNVFVYVRAPLLDLFSRESQCVHPLKLLYECAFG